LNAQNAEMTKALVGNGFGWKNRAQLLPIQRRGGVLLLLLMLSTTASCGIDALVFLRDVSTPSFLIDVQAMQRSMHDPIKATYGSMTATRYIPPPPLIVPIRIPGTSQMIAPCKTSTYTIGAPDTDRFLLEPKNLFDDDKIDTVTASGIICCGYVHCSVTQSFIDSDGIDVVELDLPSRLLGDVECSELQLVLGVNNHHVGSYYWARSAGSGAAMEAPGIVLSHAGGGASDSVTTSDRNTVLQWQSPCLVDCNSNDGKRSEWVRFLRPGDQVQLRPLTSRATRILLEQLPLYGISLAGRPLGSEPIVVCEYSIQPHTSSFGEISIV
jgi:hypothetical protein